MPSPRLEIPIFGPASAGLAAWLGASRLELNHAGSYVLGGTTPTLDELAATAAAIAMASPPVALRVMVRPRGPPAAGPDFLYGPDELAEMAASIGVFRESGLLRAERGDGFVFGVLERRRGGAAIGVDRGANAELVRLAGPFACVFHRAFDDVVAQASEAGSGEAGWQTATRDVLGCGFHGVLTSGGPGNAPENATMLRDVVNGTEGRLEVIVGGGVRSGNVASLARTMPQQARGWYHSSCLTPKSSNENMDAEEVKGMLRELGCLDQGQSMGVQRPL